MLLIILASSSPRRQELLSQAGVDFIVDKSTIEENPDYSKNPEEIVMSLAAEKALDVAKRHQNDFVLGADTIVYHQNRVLGKPKDMDDARRMIKELSGQKHYVYTGVAYVHNGNVWTEYQKSEVVFKNLSDLEIEEYINSDEPYDKAGAYAIQGLAKDFVKSINGDYFTIVGLPIKMVLLKLKKEGLIWRKNFAIQEIYIL